MQKVYGAILLALIFSSCGKDEKRLFDESADERLHNKLSEYQSHLSGAVYGWKMVITPAAGGAYFFYLDFDDANRVKMVADIDSATAVDLKESSYRLKAMQQPSLIFDTYNYLHELADPIPAVAGAGLGSGLLSDFEFFFDENSNGDSIRLTGRTNGSKATLVRATQQEADYFKNGDFNVQSLTVHLNKILQYFKTFTVGSAVYDLNINLLTKSVIISWVDPSGNPNSFDTQFYFSIDGISFVQPFSADGTLVTGLYNASWSSGTQSISVQVGNNLTATITGANKPQLLDLQAPRRWWQSMADEGGEWRSFNGFHIDGVDDAYKLRDIQHFDVLAFFPQFNTQGGITYDLAGYLMNEDGLSLNFGTAFRPPTFTADGRIRFGNYLGDLGDIPDDALDPYVNTLLKFIDTGGYYLVQTGPKTYDMVSASDSKVWINWFTVY